MRKVVISLLAAGSLLLTNTSIHANVTEGQASQTAKPWTSAHEDSSYTYETVEQVSTSKATAKKGTFKTKHNTNVRTDAGTKNKVVTLAKKGSTATATHQKKVGKEVWYKVKVNNKTGWVLSTLLTPAKAAAKAPAKKAPAKKATVKKVSAPKVTTSNGTYKVKHNSNVRSNAGTNNKIVTLAKKGTTVKSTHQTKVGNTAWYKISANGKTGWVSGTLLTKTTVKAKAPTKKAPAKKATAKASNSAAPSNLVRNAKALMGTPYKFGGTTTSGFDCSGYVQYVFNKSGKKVSRTTLGQFAESKTVSTPQVGDLVFFAGTYRAGISHVGIYIGNNQFIHAGGKKTEVRSMNDPYFKKYFHSYKRL